MKKTISLLTIMICCLLFCSCNSSVEGDKPGIAIINDCTVTIEDGFSTEYCVFNGAPGMMGRIWVNVENNSNKSVSISDLADIKVFSGGSEVSFTCFDTFDDILPGYEKSYLFTSSKSISVSKLLVQIIDGSKVITEKEIFND